jgi:hypothetical protein
MIVRTFPDRLELITQPAHAHLARRIMDRCVALEGRPRRDVILLAIREHDNGWEEEDAAPVVNPDGSIADFLTAPYRVRHGVWPRAIERLSYSPWAAALVAQHALTVYGRFRASAEWSAFFSAMQTARTRMLDASGLPLAELAADYPFVRLGDLISLAFCTATSGHSYADWTVDVTGAEIKVSPQPFGGAVIPFEIEARIIPRRAFQSDADLRAEVQAARPTTLRGEVTAAAV